MDRVNRVLDMRPDELLYHAARGYLWAVRPVTGLAFRATVYVMCYENQESERHLRVVK